MEINSILISNCWTIFLLLIAGAITSHTIKCMANKFDDYCNNYYFNEKKNETLCIELLLIMKLFLKKSDIVS